MELFDVIDSKGNPAGQIVSREKAHAEGIPHRTAHIWIIRKKSRKSAGTLSQTDDRNAHKTRILFRENLILPRQDTSRQETNHWNLHFGN